MRLRPFTPRQAAAVARARKNGGREMISPDLAKQLVKRGAATLTGNKYQRVEWNRKVKGTTLWEIRLNS